MNDAISHDSPPTSAAEQVVHLHRNQSATPVMDTTSEEQSLLAAKQGIVMWLNNDPVRAESFLRERIDSSVHVMTSYTFINCIVSAKCSFCYYYFRCC